jgi:hypothetical protein
MIYTCTYSEMRILQLIVSGTLANAGRPERVINKQNKLLYVVNESLNRHWAMSPTLQNNNVWTQHFLLQMIAKHIFHISQILSVQTTNL